MKLSTSFLGAFLAGLLLTSPASAADSQLVISPVNASGIARPKLELLIDAVATASGNTFDLRVIGPPELKQLLQPAQMRTVQKCDNLYCWAELGTTAQAQHVLAIRATNVNKNILLSIKWVNVADKQILARHQQALSDDPLTFTDGVKAALQALLAKIPAEKKVPTKAAPAEGTAEETAAPDQPAAEPGWLGVAYKSLDPTTAAKLGLSEVAGVMVLRVAPTGPAAQAGIVEGDVLLQSNGTVAKDAETLKSLLSALTTGTPVTFEVWRNKGKLTVSATMGTRPASKVPKTP